MRHEEQEEVQTMTPEDKLNAVREWVDFNFGRDDPAAQDLYCILDSSPSKVCGVCGFAFADHKQWCSR